MKRRFQGLNDSMNIDVDNKEEQNQLYVSQEHGMPNKRRDPLIPRSRSFPDKLSSFTTSNLKPSARTATSKTSTVRKTNLLDIAYVRLMVIVASILLILLCQVVCRSLVEKADTLHPHTNMRVPYTDQPTFDEILSMMRNEHIGRVNKEMRTVIADELAREVSREIKQEVQRQLRGSTCDNSNCELQR